MRKALKHGSDEEKKQYRDALSALNIEEEEFLNPEVFERNKKVKEEQAKKEEAEKAAAKAGETKAETKAEGDL